MGVSTQYINDVETPKMGVSTENGCLWQYFVKKRIKLLHFARYYFIVISGSGKAQTLQSGRWIAAHVYRQITHHWYTLHGAELIYYTCPYGLASVKPEAGIYLEFRVESSVPVGGIYRRYGFAAATFLISPK
jgi:hypothetical protein